VIWFSAVFGTRSFLMEELPIDVRPELFEDERSTIDRDTCNPALISLSKRALRAGVVEARDASGGARPKDLGGVEGFMAAVGSGDCNA
jgi:hypothetical protein